jgi:hypothetical protein
LDFTAVLVKLAHLGWGYLNAPSPHSEDAFKCPTALKGYECHKLHPFSFIDLVTLILFDEKYKLRNCCAVFSGFLLLPGSEAQIILSTLNLCSSIRVKCKVSLPYKQHKDYSLYVLMYTFLGRRR